uniref:Zgc:113276 n=1 Tax=Hippocampus comes TaxID=109280 RepID=A0A3Q2ZNF1_HIPCM
MLDVLIIGGGPHALTLASMLSPSYPKHNSNPRQRTVEGDLTKSTRAEGVIRPPDINLQVVDAYGEWTSLWKSQFTALNIPHLRSHTLVHTDPVNKKTLQEFVLKHNRSTELHSLPDRVLILDDNAFFNDTRLGRKERKRLNVSSNLKNSLSFSLPGTELSVDFFKDQVERYNLNKVLVKGTVTRITDIKYFQVQLEDGAVLKAHRVVMATGPTRAQMANIPQWVTDIEESYPEELLQHTVHLMHALSRTQILHLYMFLGSCVVCEAGQRVMVVGGGLTSAHVVSIALQNGASHVTWVMRKHLQLKQFDVGDVESLVGRYSHVEHGIKMDGQAFLRQFFNERSLHKRLAMIRQARKGGAVTPEAYIQLQPFILKGQVTVKTYCQVREANWCYRNQAWRLSLSDGDLWTGDTIWLATGCKLDVKQDPLLSEVMKEFPIQVLDGWPCISESLQWTEGCPLYLMGQYTALQIGPHAVNLAGGQAASMRIAKHILHHHNNLEVTELKAGRSKTEEYIQQMQGLLWL